MLSSASSDLGKIKFNDTYHYLKTSIALRIKFRVSGFLIAGFIHYRFWQRLAMPLLLISVFALVLVFTPLGFTHSSANRWLNLGPFSVQPAELLKFSFIIYLSAWLSLKKESSGRRKSFFNGLSAVFNYFRIGGFSDYYATGHHHGRHYYGRRSYCVFCERRPIIFCFRNDIFGIIGFSF